MPTLFPILVTLALILTSYSPSSVLVADDAPSPTEDWLAPRELAPDRPLFEQSQAVGRIERVDGGEIVTERRSDGERVSRPLETTSFILFAPHEDSESDAFDGEASYRNAGVLARIWLRNGDAFDGKLIRIDRRRVYFSAFGRELTIPRGRVVAIRLPKEENDALGNNKKGKQYSIAAKEIRQ